MKTSLNKLIILGFFLSALFFNSCSKDDTTPKVTYNNCKIMSVKILEVPSTPPSGGGWDASSGPDVFIKINVAGSTIVDATANRYSDNTSYPIGWNFVNPVVISNLNVQYDFLVYDYDTPDPDDLMGGMGYIFSNSKDYPKTLILTYQGTKLELELQWY